MKRYEAPPAFLTRIVDSYPGSQVAEAATKEKASITGMKNISPEEAAAEEAKAKGKDGEKPKEEAKPKA